MSTFSFISATRRTHQFSTRRLADKKVKTCAKKVETFNSWGFPTNNVREERGRGLGEVGRIAAGQVGLIKQQKGTPTVACLDEKIGLTTLL